ncbi:hypothetical protein BKA66DRAFT_455546 [Pyrenochaeta sp. MPI-SDFR-AT-0127]|nr:hypothetical protein BKA66DRAFT_455546 [Pyrenochaeta sp. MPI-SDFR-AT-0127]
MKLKQDTVCHTCRAHKIGCDGKLPICSQCCLTGRQCGGYKLDTVFVPYTAKTLPRSSRKAQSTKRSAEVLSNIGSAARIIGCNITGTDARQLRRCQISRPINSASSDEFTAVILNLFVPRCQQNLPSLDTSTSQVCGAWVGVLPSLVARAGSRELISSATKAFGTIILDRSHQGKNTSFQCREAYIATLQQLKNDLLSPKNFFRIETAAAIVCLAMVELMLPTSGDGIPAHFGGLGALISLFPPELFSSGDFHAIFVGCRPVLLFQALTARKSTFLGQEKWLITPFRHHPPSEIQTLIGDAANLPSIMEEVDVLQTLPQESAVPRAYKMKIMLEEVLGRLSKWNGRFGRDANGPPDPSQQMEVLDCPQHAESHFWFPSLLAANVHTHMWAFQIMCLTELEKLTPYSSDHDYACKAGEAQKGIDARISVFAARICQCMKYLLQDEMKLFGPASALFPLKIAYDVLDRDRERNKEQIERCWRLFDQIRDRGYLSRFLYPTERREIEICT